VSELRGREWMFGPAEEALWRLSGSPDMELHVMIYRPTPEDGLYDCQLVVRDGLQFAVLRRERLFWDEICEVTRPQTTKGRPQIRYVSCSKPFANWS